MTKVQQTPCASPAAARHVRRAQCTKRKQSPSGAKRKAAPATAVLNAKVASFPSETASGAAVSALTASPTSANGVLGKLFSESTVTRALAEVLALPHAVVHCMMVSWAKPILKVPVPGVGGKVPSKLRLEAAKRTVLRFLDAEEALGLKSDVVKAFYIATREPQLDFNWEEARRRVRCARLDRRRAIDDWDGCLAMNSGETVSTCEIFVCGTRPITLRALVSLLCHESLHNFARRTRRGNPYVSEDTEHIAMALLGDPQLQA